MPSQSLDQKTADAAFKHIALWEGFEDTVYADYNGVPHIGYGFALIVKSGGKWEIKTDLKKKLNAVGVTWEEADDNKLEEIRDTLNAGTASEATALIDGHPFSAIAKPGAEQLTRDALPEYEGYVKAAIGEGVYAGLDAERRGVLIDAAYASPGQLNKVGPQLGAALAKGDFDQAAQILEQGMGPVDSKGDRARADAEFLRDPSIPGYYRVQRDEVLGVIARRLSQELGRTVTVKELQQLNNLPDPDLIGAGQLLRVPGNDAPQGQQPATPAPSSGQQPATPAPGQRSGLEGRAGKAAARAASGEDPANTPAGHKLLADFTAEPGGSAAVGEALFTPVGELTKDQVGAFMADPDYWRTTTPRGQLLQNRVRAWYDHFFGTGPAPEDETGRMLPSRPAHPIPTAPAPVRAADGSELAGSVFGIGKQVLAAAAESGLSEAIRGLQSGLNGLQTGGLNGLSGVMGDSGAVGMDGPALAVDGIFGPRTRRRLRGALAALGRAPVEKGFARSFARFRPAGSSARPGSRV